ncbi:hypothetical protein PSE_4547 [Pseudovibrio sp. FO-BEG1]|nr:hypothetical protein PSE_4547 [Pseudovibrio sp. FO-BEG1]
MSVSLSPKSRAKPKACCCQPATQPQFLRKCTGRKRSQLLPLSIRSPGQKERKTTPANQHYAGIIISSPELTELSIRSTQ